MPAKEFEEKLRILEETAKFIDECCWRIDVVVILIGDDDE